MVAGGRILACLVKQTAKEASLQLIGQSLMRLVRQRIDRMRETRCPFCGHDPYHYVDIGVGYEPAAVNCCDLGVDLFQYGTKKARKLAALKSSPSPRKQARFKRMMAEHWREPVRCLTLELGGDE